MRPVSHVEPVLLPIWLPEDFAPSRPLIRRSIDPWEPAPAASKVVQATSAAPITIQGEHWSTEIKQSAKPSRPVCSVADPWDPGVSQSHSSAPTPLPDPWEPHSSDLSDTKGIFVDEPLPIFEAGLRNLGWKPDVFEHRRVPTPRLKAHWVTAILEPATAQARARIQRGFELIFTERDEKAFFRKVFGLAADGAEGDELLAAAQLKIAWDETPGLWFYRSSPRAAPVCGLRGRKAMTWPKALIISEGRSYCPPAEMISDEWIEDWMRLQLRDAGYWTLADYATLRSQESEFANHREFWRYDLEERMWDREAPTPHIASSEVTVAIGAGARAGNVPAALAERFLAWREEQTTRRRIPRQ